jgi:hypothetical protein
MLRILPAKTSNNIHSRSVETDYQNVIGRTIEESREVQIENNGLLVISLKVTDAEQLSEFHSKKLKDCEAKGREHGKRLMPPIDETEIEPFEKRVVADYQAQVANFFAHGNGVLATIESDISHISEQLNKKDQIQARTEKTISEAKSEKERASELEEEKHRSRVKRIHDQPKWEIANKEFGQAKEHYDKERKEMGNVTPDSVRHLWYVPFLIGISLPEIPLNFQVFKVFREVPILTLIMALSLVIGIPFLAHGCGKFLKQIREFPKVYPILFIVSLFLIISISYVTAQLRADFLATKGVLITQLEVAIFFLIGILLFFAGFIASFFVHNQSEKVIKAKSRYAIAEEQYTKFKAEIDQSLDEESERHEKRVDEINQLFISKERETIEKIKTLENDLHTRVGNYNSVLSNLKGVEKSINQNCKAAIQRYRQENLLHRDHHAQPLAWKKDLPDLDLYFQAKPEIVETTTFPQKSLAANSGS